MSGRGPQRQQERQAQKEQEERYKEWYAQELLKRACVIAPGSPKAVVNPQDDLVQSMDGIKVKEDEDEDEDK